MAPAERSTQYHIVTTSEPRASAFASIFGAEKVRRVTPLFTEDTIRKPINTIQPAEWPIETAEQKAFQDIAAHMVRSYLTGMVDTGCMGDCRADGQRVIRIYSDTINIAYAGDVSDESTLILEKPKNLERWMNDRERGAMALSGKYTELCTALTAIDMTDPNAHPNTVLVRTTVKMKPFTKDDVKEFVARHGEQAIMKSASGISFINGTVELFDTNSPLRTYIQTDPNLPPSLLFELPTWDHLSHQDRLRLLYGAVPEAMYILTNGLPKSNPSAPSKPTSERYGKTV